MIIEKNTYILKPIFEKMAKQGVHTIIVPFSGGGDCGGFDGDIKYRDKNDKDIKLDYDKIQIDGTGIDKFRPLIGSLPAIRCFAQAITLLMPVKSCC